MKREPDTLLFILALIAFILATMANFRGEGHDYRLDTLERQIKLAHPPCPCLEAEQEAPALDLPEPRWPRGVVR